MDPLTGVAMGLGALSSLSGMLGAARARRRATEAIERTISAYLDSTARGLGTQTAYARQQLATLAGDLARSVATGASSLSETLKRSGIYNPTTVAGVITQTQNARDKALAAAAADLARDIESKRLGALDAVLQMRAGAAARETDYAAAQQAGALNALSQLFAIAGQLFGQQKPAGAQQTPASTRTPAQTAPAMPAWMAPATAAAPVAGYITAPQLALPSAQAALQSWLQQLTPYAAGSQLVGPALNGSSMNALAGMLRPARGGW